MTTKKPCAPKTDPMQGNIDRIAYLVEAINEAGRRAEKIVEAMGGGWTPKLAQNEKGHVGLALRSIEHGNVVITISVENEVTK